MHEVYLPEAELVDDPTIVPVADYTCATLTLPTVNQLRGVTYTSRTCGQVDHDVNYMNKSSVNDGDFCPTGGMQ
jgi:hypothetical protein